MPLRRTGSPGKQHVLAQPYKADNMPYDEIAMTSQLDQFCALFPTEKELQDVLVELLGRFKGVTGVRKLQGTTERGKDIIFYHLGPFGSRRLNACVVKNTSITGSVASASG